MVPFLNINIDYKPLNTNNFIYSMFQGFAELYTLIVLISKLYNEQLVKFKYNVNNRCLYILATAQIQYAKKLMKTLCTLNQE